MLYVSTRGGAPPREFADILLEGLAPDGGLYVPKEIPRLPPLPDDYASAVAALVRPFVEPDPLAGELEEMVADVYGRFRHPDVAPLTQVDNDLYVLELFWGPTLSFKDYALQLVGPLFQRVLEREGRRLVVLGATSGDTGSAAIEGCRGLPGIEIVILYPEGAVSEVQRRQMTTVPDANVHAVAVRGTFDDCQRLVKQAFTTLGDRHPLGAVNSINWARIVAQSAYYAYWAQRLGRPVRFVVPTGNFGNVYAAHLARRMGAEISKLVVANNANHGLADLVTTGVLRVSAVEHTFAPAMDIQVPSNLERYLYEAVGESAGTIREMQDVLVRRGILQLPAEVHARLREAFDAGWLTDADIVATIRRVHAERGIVLDPHTATAWAVAERAPAPGPTVVVGTAHPAKFPEVVEEATGTAPALPQDLAGLLSAPERIRRIEPDLDALAALLDEVAS